MTYVTAEKYNELKYKAIDYLKLLGVSWDDWDECLGRAFLKFAESVHSNPDEDYLGEHWIWKSCVYQAVVDHRSQDHRMQFVLDNESHYDGDYEKVDAKQFYRRMVIDKVFHFLTDEDITFLVTYIDNDLNMYTTAKVLDRRPTNLYPVLQRIQAKVRLGLPELTKTRVPGKKQGYKVKTDKWGQFFMAVEQVDYREWGSFYYQEQQEYGPVPFGIIPGTSPTRQQMSVRSYERRGQ